MSEPAYTRLDVDVRRAQLLKLGTELFTQHAYDELSMADIARAAGISKPLLYHYFASKQEFFAATLAQAAEEVRVLTEPDPDLPPLEALTKSVDAYLGWIEQHPVAYSKLIQSATSHAEVRQMIDAVRDLTSARIVAGITGGKPAPGTTRAAVRAWLWYMDGACNDWLQHGDYSREQLRDLLMGTLLGALNSAGALTLPTQPEDRS